jgi:putative RecB family exonuclease
VVYPVPTSLSPSRVDAFTSCPLQFRFASIEKLPEPPGIHATKGSLVHRALELLFCRPAPLRTPAAGRDDLAQAIEEYRVDPDFTGLALEPAAEEAFFADAAALVEAYFRIEDPTQVREIGIELRLEARIGDLALRGVIDRLDLDAGGELVVTDYKTGRPPFQHREQQKLGGVNFYAFLCQEVLGRRPTRVRLMFLRTGEVIEATPSEQSVRFLTQRTAAVFQAVEKACRQDDFRPRPSGLCGFCNFKQWCPSFGGDPDRAALESPLALGLTPA